MGLGYLWRLLREDGLLHAAEGRDVLALVEGVCVFFCLYAGHVREPL